MASVQEPGLVKLYRRAPDGSKTPIFAARVEQLAPAGGAPDAAPASVSTPEKLLKANFSGVVLMPDDIVEVAFVADGADGIDVSDCIWSIPFSSAKTGTLITTLSRGNFANPAPVDYTTVASMEMVVGGYRVTEGPAYIGGAPIYIDMQDDT